MKNIRSSRDISNSNLIGFLPIMLGFVVLLICICYKWVLIPNSRDGIGEFISLLFIFTIAGTLFWILPRKFSFGTTVKGLALSFFSIFTLNMITVNYMAIDNFTLSISVTYFASAIVLGVISILEKNKTE